MLTFFPARGGDDEEAVGIMTHGNLQTVQNRQKNRKFQIENGKSKKSLALSIRNLDK